MNEFKKKLFGEGVPLKSPFKWHPFPKYFFKKLYGCSVSKGYIPYPQVKGTFPERFRKNRLIITIY